MKHLRVGGKLIVRVDHGDHVRGQIDGIRRLGGGAGYTLRRPLKRALGILHAAQCGVHYVHIVLIGRSLEILQPGPKIFPLL